jgi:2'-5' RNA ligase
MNDGWVYVKPPRSIQSAVVSLGLAIDKDHLAADGIDTDPHVTIVYKLLETSPVSVFKAVKNRKPVVAKIGELGIFENDDFDVLKFEIASSQLRDLNRSITESCLVETLYPTYRPHMTVAYLKKGEGKQYVSAKTKLPGLSFVCEELFFRLHQKNGLIRIKLNRGLV